jgi:hypothetical protein
MKDMSVFAVGPMRADSVSSQAYVSVHRIREFLGSNVDTETGYLELYLCQYRHNGLK